jgi:hypothetical protein
MVAPLRNCSAALSRSLHAIQNEKSSRRGVTSGVTTYMLSYVAKRGRGTLRFQTVDRADEARSV